MGLEERLHEQFEWMESQKKYSITFENRKDFNLATDWNLDELINHYYDIGYSDRILIFENIEDRNSFEKYVIMNKFKYTLDNSN